MSILRLSPKAREIRARLKAWNADSSRVFAAFKKEGRRLDDELKAIRKDCPHENTKEKRRWVDVGQGGFYETATRCDACGKEINP